MASRWVKWALRISAGIGGIIALCFVILVAWIAIELGLRWPTVQHVDQGPWADTLCIKAEDFLDDSGYVVTTSFESCCTDKGLCGWPLQNSETFRLNKAHNFVAVPLQWTHRSMCPYRLRSVDFESYASHKDCSFSGDSTLAPFPEILDPDCLRYHQEDSVLLTWKDPKGCSHQTISFSLPNSKDTLFIRKVQY
jgi:hypothetical protein